jgi:hypothetical protein
VVLVRVTETHKWHISGRVINASPQVPHVDSAAYFKERERKRKEEQQETRDPVPEVEYKIIEEKVLMKASPVHFALHLFGMVLLALGVYGILKAVNGPRTVYM